MTAPGATNDVESILAAAVAHERSADWYAAELAFTEVFRYGVEQRNTSAIVDALRGQSRVYQRMDRFGEAEEVAEASLEIADRAGLPRAAARAMNTLAAIRHLQNDWDGAQERYAAAIQRALDSGDDALIGWTYQNIAVFEQMRGDIRVARMSCLESVASSVRSGDPVAAVAAYNSLGVISGDLGDWTEALLYFDRGMEVAEQFGDVAMSSTLGTNRAEALIHLGELDRALEALSSAGEQIIRTGDHRRQVDLYRFRATICRLREDFDAAESHVQQAIALAEASGFDLERAEAVEECAHLRWAQGRHGAARMLLREAEHLFHEMGARTDLARLEEQQSQWAAHASDGSEPAGGVP
ncbi:MAG TPA: tetratricopeptide repeat protein [Longimicrobiaceae bacterium]|nr:tetratricopeptide repeat protein [Longimicrobiaceae bacterium]